MVIDSHCHAWRYWPYEPSVPDPESRGRVEQLLFEMDRNGVEQAAVVCARIDHNPDNNEYVAECVAKYPDRLHQIADVDCSWMETYHTPGAADRLAETAQRWPIKGFTHYVRAEDDGAWFLSGEGLAFFEVARDLGLIVSLSIQPELQPVLREVARRFPEVPFLCHHMAGVRAGEVLPHDKLNAVLASADVPNIFIKLSGFAYVSQVSWEYPFQDTLDLVQDLYDAFGAGRLCWGSDYPVVRTSMTYRHALEAFRTHCTFVSEADRGEILGGTLARLLREARTHKGGRE